MNLYFDSEFTGLYKDTTLISIGIVSESGERFYAELSDYDRRQCYDWIKENVIGKLRLCGARDKEKVKELKSKGYQVSIYSVLPDGYTTVEYGISHETEDGITEVYGDSAWVREQLGEWLSRFEEVQFVSDVCHYDFVLLVDLFWTAFDLPKNVNPACHDINQDIARHYGISEKEAFDMSREEIAMDLQGYPIDGEKHNSLYDAEVVKAIYHGLNSAVQ